MKLVMLVDFGSTYTKVRLFDLASEQVVAASQAKSTVKENMIIGLHNALDSLKIDINNLNKEGIAEKLACSSAAGGLRVIAVGLVPELTLEAAKKTALGAGAKLVGTYSHKLIEEDLREINAVFPDMILLAGGTDGGNKEVILHNARMIAGSDAITTVLVAGNREAGHEVKNILARAGKSVEVTENVLPELNILNVEPARERIRELFMKRITRAKGLDKATEYVGNILMPTPMATLKAAQLLADGTEDEPGLNDLLVVEVGGATTNVHSVSHGEPSRPDMIVKGIPEPYAKRTVEGDLGVRYNALTIFDIVGERKLSHCIEELCHDKVKVDLKQHLHHLNTNIGYVPHDDIESWIDTALAKCAVEVAVTRHCGHIQEYPTAMGLQRLLHGKDLTRVGKIVGTGGVFAHSKSPDKILEDAIFNPLNPAYLKPQAPELYIDKDYVLYAVGLLSDIEPTIALRIAKKSLQRIPYRVA